MLNFRKLRQDFAPAILKEGKELFDKGCIAAAKILRIDGSTIKLSARIRGAYDNFYECEVEINRGESAAVDSNCDCSYTYDCQHISALLFYLEAHFNEIVVEYSKEEANLEKIEELDEEDKQELKETFEVAATKEVKRRGEAFQKEVLSEYVSAARVLGTSPFFIIRDTPQEDKAEIAFVFNLSMHEGEGKAGVEVQLALRLPFRSKALFVPNVKAFIEAISYREPIIMGGKKFFFTLHSFQSEGRELLEMLMREGRFYGGSEERYLKSMQVSSESFGNLLSHAFEAALAKAAPGCDKEMPLLGLFCGNLEEPLLFSTSPAEIHFGLEYLEVPAPTILVKPKIVIEEESLSSTDVVLLESSNPSLIHKNIYYRFRKEIARLHLKHLPLLEDLAIPEPLFGTFVEYALPVLRRYGQISNLAALRKIVTLPYGGEIKGHCQISYLNGELEAKLFFLYDKASIPASLQELSYKQVTLFASDQGILARNLVEERQIIEDLFADFLYDEKEGLYRTKSEKKIVEFMTEVIPRYCARIKFDCPENLADQFLYDDSTFELHLKESDRIDAYEVELKVEGGLRGASLDLLWECIGSRKRFLELTTSVPVGKDKKVKTKMPKILVLDLDKIAPLVQIFDEIGIKKLDNHKEERPLWSLTTIQSESFENLPVKFTMSEPLREIQRQILGKSEIAPEKFPKEIQAQLRKYQLEGVHWLERLRRMHLSGILADDMGLGKTLQAIIAITQSKVSKKTAQSLVVSPTSLVYNWKEEIYKFNPQLKAVVIDGTPQQRRRILKDIASYDVIITSYNLLQKDIEIHRSLRFDYMILDEGQHIKNRTTRNAKSVKQISAAHRLILTGTPIENSLEELWSLFDFLMPGLLSTYDRFVEKYIRQAALGTTSHLENLRRKVSPFILRRMKEDVLDDLPAVSEIFYHCHLSEAQKVLYHSYAASAKEELSKLVKKEGFEKIQIHVLATLTRLKQICCHPAIFAKEKSEVGDSAKYDMLMELLPTLVEGKHKTVIFSQYTKMLTILREDLEKKGYRFAYLDGSSKNRLEIVKQFNDDPKIAIFLVSLKAGGSGLNLVGADTVIHYDMWWNPAVESQATDRVHRIGQKKSVSSYKLITLNTIEEKILQLHKRKMGLVKKVISSDDEAISRLTWEEVLELLQT